MDQSPRSSRKKPTGIGWADDPVTTLSKPEGFRPQSARPQSHRFLQETSLKLAHDSIRSHLQRFPAGTPLSEDASTVGPDSAGTSARSSPLPMCHEEMLIVSSFLPEASECVRSLSVIFDSANASSFATSFEDWNKVDHRARAQVPQFLDLLNGLNRSMDNFLTRCLPPDQLKDFHGSIFALVQSVKDLERFQKSLSSGLNDLCERVAETAFATWRQANEAAFIQIQNRLDRQMEQQQTVCAQQQRADSKLDDLGVSVGFLCQKMKEQDRSTGEARAALNGISETCFGITSQQENMSEKHLEIDRGLEFMARQIGLLSEASTRQSEQVDEIIPVQKSIENMCRSSLGFHRQTHDGLSANTPWWLENLQKELLQQSAADSQSLKEYVDEVLGRGIGDTLVSLERSISDCMASSLNETTSLGHEVTRLQELLRENDSEISALQSARDIAVDDREDLEKRMGMLNVDLHKMQEDLALARSASVTCSFERLQDIESRGNVKVNRQTGHFVLLREISFSPASPGKTCPDVVGFESPREAKAVLADVAEVVKIFNMPVRLMVNCKLPRGKSSNQGGVFQDYAWKLAELMQGELESDAALAGKISASGALGGANEILFAFKESYFAKVQEGKTQRGGRSGRSGSPTRR